MCLYCKIKNRLVEIIQKYPVLLAVCYPNYEQLSSTEDTNTNVSSSKTQQAEFCHIRDFKPSLALLVPPTCITEHRALQKLGLCSLSYPSSHMNIETNHMAWPGVQKCWFEPCLSQMLGAQEMPQLIGIS